MAAPCRRRYGLSPEFLPLIRAGKLQAWNFPFGCVSQMIRDAAAGRVGPVTRIGIGTYVSEKVRRSRQVAGHASDTGGLFWQQCATMRQGAQCCAITAQCHLTSTPRSIGVPRSSVKPFNVLQGPTTIMGLQVAAIANRDPDHLCSDAASSVQGGKLTSPSQEDLVHRVSVGSQQLLHYAAPVIDVAVLRGTTADVAGNISFEREAVLGDSLNQVLRLASRLLFPAKLHAGQEQESHDH